MLEVKNLAVSYGRHRALESVSVEVDKGEICVILGANGAGKSTLLKAIAGMVAAEPGSEILMNRRPIGKLKPHRIVEEGIALVPEGRGIFGDLTVAENLQLGAFAGRARRAERATLDLVYGLFPRLAERRRQVARTMSGGEQQMVAIGRALMSRPEILMLDEPSLGLSPLLTKELFRSLTEVAATGVGILLVEQNAKQSLAIAGRGYLIENGAVTGENSAQALMRDPAVVSAYLGGGGGRGARPLVNLPAPMRLPLDLGAMGRLMADLATRAGHIQHAFVRALRQSGNLPSAFVGRYDPKAGGDPWSQPGAETAMPIPAGKASEEAKRLADQAAVLARRAGERHAAHIRTTRLTATRPSAFSRLVQAQEQSPPAPAATPQPRPRDTRAGDTTAESRSTPASETLDVAGLATRAAERSAAFVRSRREALPRPTAFNPAPDQPAPAGEPGGRSEPERVHPLIGHNSGKGAFEDAVPQPVGASDMAALATRAAERSAAFLRARRQAAPRPTAFAQATQPRDTAAFGRIESFHPPIGHHKGGEEPEEENQLAPAHTGSLSIAELAARAASIHTAHVAQRRKMLTAFVIPAGIPPESTGKFGKPDEPAERQRKKHKEA